MQDLPLRPPPTTDEFVSVVFVRSKPGESENLGRLLLGLVPLVRTDRGCITYDVHHSTSDPNLWFVYERWQSEADFESHIATPHFRLFNRAYPTVTDGDPTICTFRPRSLHFL